MAMDTCLQMVDAKEIAALKKTPTSIGPLGKPRARLYSTYYPCSINFFLVGAPYPAPTSSPLSAALFGRELIDCEALEAGHFGIVPRGKVAAIASRLEKVDLKKVAAAFAKANRAHLARTIDDFELLISDDHASKQLD